MYVSCPTCKPRWGQAFMRLSAAQDALTVMAAAVANKNALGLCTHVANPQKRVVDQLNCKVFICLIAWCVKHATVNPRAQRKVEKYVHISGI